MREKDYVVIIGSANIDVAGYSHESLNYADSNPGKIKFTPGGVGRNIAQNLALLGNKAWLLSAVGSDFYGQSLLTQTNQSGVYVDKCLIVPGENTSREGANKQVISSQVDSLIKISRIWAN
ncbi:PfkB family carbohydrate kinase, partial [Escherichia coli]|nr:PfkB family carbohydrate kinase [Escherichia coli]